MTPLIHRARARAFTLVELLVVLTIIGIISAISVSIIPLMLKANQLDSSVGTLSGILEQARETAISANTYIWVAFTGNLNNTGGWVALIQSQDGTELPINSTTTPSWATTVTIPGGNLQLVSKLQDLPGLKIVDASQLPASVTSLASSMTSTTTLFEPSGMQWTVTPLQNTGAGAGNYFTHAVEFTPTGEARCGATAWYTNIQFGLIPVTGSTSNPTNSALFNISRQTGKLTVYRP